jgi:hypothetical protein
MNIIKKIKNMLFEFIFSYQEITIGDLFNKYTAKPVNIYDDNKLKFISEIDDIENVLVEGEYGFIPILKLFKTIKYNVWNIRTKNNYKLKCADKHILIDDEDNEIFVEDIFVGQKIKTKFGIDEIVLIEEENKKENMYDMELIHTHKYFTNNILSHNTITTSGYILHYIIFKQNKNIAILANKGSTARKILTKIKDMYKKLPIWLQVGVVEWNKGNVVFGNGNTIEASNTSSDGIRGDSISLVYIDECVKGNTYITVRNKKTGQIKRVQIVDFFENEKRNL